MQIILIPAYKPDEKLILFAKELLAAGCTVVSVDDGSGEDCRPFFVKAQTMGVYVLTHERNRGKGAALRTGFQYIAEHFPEADGVITADCDGQHMVKDILRVARFMKRYPNRMVLGGRFSEKRNIPLRSAFGNYFTRMIYRIATGLSIRDTQTGLRGIPMKYLPKLLAVPGDRYEYEMNVLLKLKEWELKFLEIPIATIYIDDNRASHYNPLRDSWRILKQILKFCASSIFCFFIDYVLFLFFDRIFEGGSSTAYICARVLSGGMNYFFNSRFVFKKATSTTLLKYIVVALAIAGLGSGGTGLFKEWFHMPSVLCKFFVDMPLFVASYVAQREFVFRKLRGSKAV